MTLADRIRDFAFQRYNLPAVKEGKKVVVRSGDVHRAMGLVSQMPSVVNALRSRKTVAYFEERLRKAGYKVGVGIVALRTLPSGYGINAYFKYVFLLESPLPPPPPPPSKALDKVPEKGAGTGRQQRITENLARELMSEYLGVRLYKARLDINGKTKGIRPR